MRTSIAALGRARSLLLLGGVAGAGLHVGACSSRDASRHPAWDPASRIGVAEVSTASAGRDLGGVGIDAQGNAFVAYRRVDGARANVVVSRRTAAGWSAPEPVDADGDAVPLVTVNGLKHVLWSSRAGDRFSIKSSRYEPARGWAPADALATQAAAPEVTSAAAAADGSALVAWHDYDKDNLTRPRVSRSAAPAGWNAADVLAAKGSREEAIAVNARGDAAALWVEVDGSASRLAAKRLRAGGGWDADATVLTDPTPRGQVASARAVVDANGDAVATWLVGGSVWASRSPAGGGWDVAAPLDNSGSITAQDAPFLCAGKGGATYAVWTSGRDIRFRSFNAASGWSEVDAVPASPQGAQADADASAEPGAGRFTRATQPRCAVNRDGHLVIVVVGLVTEPYRGDAGEDLSTSTGLYVQTPGIWAVTFDGRSWARTRLSPERSGGIENPEIAASESGTIVAAWENFDDAGVSIWAARFE
jgi:hypothetical protein